MYKKLLLIIGFVFSLGNVFAADNVEFSSKVDSQWEGGYCYKFFINNISGKELNGRSITFDIDNSVIYERWSADFVRTSGGYKISGLDWNNPLKINQSFDVGFCTNSTGKPYNIKFVSSGGTSVSTNTQPVTNTTVSNTPSTISPVQPSTGIYKAPFYAREGKLYDSDNKVVQLRGVNWFGFESDIYTVHGLWTRGYKEMIEQMKTLGFNAVRLPFCPALLEERPTGGIDFSKNPDLKGLNSLQMFDKIIGELAKEGFYIIADIHNPDCTVNITETPVYGNYSLDKWISNLTFVADRYKNIPNFIGLDPKNEPHGKARWGNGDINTDRKMQVERAGQEILKKNPNLLIFIEGISDNGGDCESGSYRGWGENFEPLSCYPVDTSKIPANKTVLSPHVYGPDVAMRPAFNDPSYPENMPQIWDRHFGKLADKYTIIPGEFGGKYGEGNPLDAIWQNKFVDYLISKGIRSFFFWSLNPNSGDTGGILKDDWTSVNTAKYNNLKRLFVTDNSMGAGNTVNNGNISGSGGVVIQFYYSNIIDNYFKNLPYKYSKLTATIKVMQYKNLIETVFRTGVITNQNTLDILQYILNKINIFQSS